LSDGCVRAFAAFEIPAAQRARLEAELGELRQRGVAAVDPGLGAAIGADHPADQAVPAIVIVVALQPGQGLGGIVQAEFGRQFGTFRAVPDHTAFGARAGQAQQRVHQQ